MGDNFSWVPYVVAAAVCVVVIAGLLIYTKIKASKDNKNGGSNDGNDNQRITCFYLIRLIFGVCKNYEST